MVVCWQRIRLQCRRPWFDPWVRRSTGEGIGHPLQYSWASLVALLVKNLPAMQETWVRSLGWKDTLKEDMATHSSILAWRISMDIGAWRATVMGSQSHTRLSTAHRFVIALLPRSKCLLILWLQSPSAVILEPKKIKSVTASTFPLLFAMKWWDRMPWP